MSKPLWISSQIAEATNGKVQGDWQASGISIDTRTRFAVFAVAALLPVQASTALSTSSLIIWQNASGVGAAA